MDIFLKHSSKTLFTTLCKTLWMALFTLMFCTLSIASDDNAKEKAKEKAKENAETLFIDAVVKPDTPYIQQQVKYTLRLWRQSHLQRGYFLTPDIPDVLVIPAPATSQRTVIRDGREYELLQQPYFIFPQRSGEIRLPPPVFSSQDLFKKGKPRVLTVKPAMDEKTMQPWVIASNIILDQQWHFPDKPIQVGQPIERTLIIRGEGIIGAQLPNPGITSIENMHIQQLATETRYDLKDNQVLGTRIERFRYIPTQAGDYKINDITIKWWNSRSDTEIKTLAPGYEIHIIPASVLPDTQHSISSSDAEMTRISSAETEVDTITAFSDWKLILLVFSTSLVAYLIWKYRLYQRLKNRVQIYSLYRDVLTACKNNDVAGIKDSLLQWAQLKLHTGNSATLLSLSQFTTDNTVIKALSALDQALYSRQHLSCSAGQLKQTLRGFMSSAVTGSDKKNHCLPDMWF
jgi:hypothetical protein